MARSIFLLEDGTGGFELESGIGVLLLEVSSSFISGASGSITVLDQPLNGVMVSWVGPANSSSTVTDVFGEWSTGSILISGTYIFTPILAGYTFIPPGQIVLFAGTDVLELNFTASSFFTAGKFPPPEMHITYSGNGTVFSAMHNPDNNTGSGAVPTLNENLPLKVVPAPPLMTNGEVRGRFDQFNVINNPA